MLFWSMASLLFRLRFQFLIRSLLVLTITVAIPCSWQTLEIRKAKKQRETVGAAYCQPLSLWIVAH